MARMRDIKAEGRKRRAQFLAEFLALGPEGTITELAEKHKMTRARMSQIIIQAKAEASTK